MGKVKKPYQPLLSVIELEGGGKMFYKDNTFTLFLERKHHFDVKEEIV